MPDEPRQLANKKVLLEIPLPLYEQYRAWMTRQGCVTDAEGIRAAIRKAISLGPLCQGGSQ